MTLALHQMIMSHRLRIFSQKREVPLVPGRTRTRMMNLKAVSAWAWVQRELQRDPHRPLEEVSEG